MNWIRHFFMPRVTDSSGRRGLGPRQHQRGRLLVEGLESRCLLSGGLDANQRFIGALYQEDLGRIGSDAEVNGWLPTLVSHGMTAVVIGIENSTEARGRIVRNIYGDDLGRLPSASEQQAIVSSFLKGATWEVVSAAILGSDEFFNRAPTISGVGGGAPSNITFVSALHHQLLNRDPTPAESTNYIVHALPQVGREGVALMVLQSAEYRGDVIQLLYGNHPILGVLHRANPPSSSEVATWVNSGMSLGNIHFAFENSAEKFGLGSNGLDANQRYIQTLYQDTLGRTGSSIELTAWEQVMLTRGQGAVVSGFHQSAEARSRLVKTWYLNFLGRNAVQGEEQGFVAALNAGMSEELALSFLLGSGEYYLHAPQIPGAGGNVSANQSFIRAIYVQLLNRTPGTSEVSPWENQLASLGRSSVAAAFLGSGEFRASAIGSFYASLLQRANSPTPAEVNGWVSSGQGLWAIERAFESSFEMFAPRFKFATMGDSITDDYAKYVGNNPQTGLPLWGNNGDQSWVEQLKAARSANWTASNVAMAGAASVNLIAQGQHSTVAGLVFQGVADTATLIIGANDLATYLVTVKAGGSTDATPYINLLAADIQLAVDTVQNGGKVRQVIANVPDIGKTPQMQALIAGNATLANLVTNAVVAVNKKIEDFAATRGIPVVDLYALEKLSATPFSVAGAQISNLFAPDGYNPGTVLQGLLANSILEAEKVGYGCTVAGLKLSDQEILAAAKISNPGGLTYYDVSGYVKAAKPYQSQVRTIFAIG